MCWLARKSHGRVDDESAQRFFTDIVAAGREVDDPTDVALVSRDPDDDYLIALAIGHTADLVVTGYADLLDLDASSVPVIGVRAPLELLGTDRP
jgi:predicted nucleic acid-binding protein